MSTELGPDQEGYASWHPKKLDKKIKKAEEQGDKYGVSRLRREQADSEGQTIFATTEEGDTLDAAPNFPAGSNEGEYVMAITRKSGGGTEELASLSGPAFDLLKNPTEAQENAQSLIDTAVEIMNAQGGVTADVLSDIISEKVDELNKKFEKE